MDFSSKVPVFLDPPTWHQGVERQITNQMQPSSSGIINSSNPLQIPPPSGSTSGGGSGQGLIKPGSMVDRARLAQVPLPEAGLKCPRCESTNTKFCYFNNYNLSQPRHFCKGCRRYWTRGGTLRNVPVGGGCRRNKRSKPKSRTGSKADPVPAQIIRRVGSNNTTNTSANELSSQMILPPPHPDPFLPGLHHLNGYGIGYGLNLGGGGGGTADAEQLSSLLAGSCVTGSGLYPFDEGAIPDHNNSGFGRVKMDENHQGLNLSKNFMLGIQGNTNIGDQYSSWGAGINAWTDISGFHGSSSSSGHLL